MKKLEFDKIDKIATPASAYLYRAKKRIDSRESNLIKAREEVARLLFEFSQADEQELISKDRQELRETLNQKAEILDRKIKEIQESVNRPTP